ncbi:hypothetical protein DL765_010480 [Monosporascus sp. GIB2]|nr:hypothetical protein DL765_010480 [Monosporascus sp. GIB2]
MTRPATTLEEAPTLPDSAVFAKYSLRQASDQAFQPAGEGRRGRRFLDGLPGAPAAAEHESRGVARLQEPRGELRGQRPGHEVQLCQLQELSLSVSAIDCEDVLLAVTTMWSSVPSPVTSGRSFSRRLRVRGGQVHGEALHMRIRNAGLGLDPYDDVGHAAWVGRRD